MRFPHLSIILLCAAALVGLGGCSKTTEHREESSSAAGDATAAGPGNARSDPASTSGAAGGATRAAAGGPAGPAVSGHEAAGAPGAEASTAAAQPPPADAGAAQVVAPSPAPPADTATGSQALGGVLTWTVPATWMEQTPHTPMRRAQFRVPGKGGAKQDAECVVFYFGPGQGGSAQSNATRWVDQFQQPDGSSSEAQSKIDVRTVNGNQVMFVEVKGTYTPMAMPGAAQAGPKPGYAMIGAIVSASDAPWFFKLTGPAATVEANRDAFESLIASLKPSA